MSLLGFLVAEHVFADLPEGSLVGEECIHHLGVKMFSPVFHDNLHSLFVGVCFLIHALGRQCIVYIRQCDDPRRQRNLITFKSLGISGSVPFFVVVIGDLLAQAEERLPFDLCLHGLERIATQRGMAFDHFEFVPGKPAGLQENGIRDSHLTDVVENG